MKLEGGPRRITLAQKRNYSIYKNLNLYDHDWIIKFNLDVWREAYVVSKADAFLEEAIARLRLARANLESLAKPVRITGTALRSVSGLGTSTRPDIRELLSQLLESKEEFRERASNYWLSRLNERQAITRQRFEQITGLGALSDEHKHGFKRGAKESHV
ncbi:hypothetical protein M3I53_01775 [Paraburkholderia sp. CNPSo 3272]|uniref:hypothetical protein n=1 Tax=Paraburkholderia sp. CNPSo 3272 TaxID=2940931 RepID=UPI0020B8DFC0|nr:hypothetical protein [Paraburkholderia sp. CNPSo 3272]MCP3721862.1 hypothetical protein [Paraburkholderia sp. CNPSo 3272]